MSLAHRPKGEHRSAQHEGPPVSELGRAVAAALSGRGALAEADASHVEREVQQRMAQAVAQSPALAKLVSMREELRQLWTRTNVSPSQLVSDLQAWCKHAEESGIAALQEFSLRLRAAHA